MSATELKCKWSVGDRAVEGDVEKLMATLNNVFNNVKTLATSLDFSSVTEQDLLNLGIVSNLLHFEKPRIEQVVAARLKDDRFKTVCDVMSKDILDIYAHFNMPSQTMTRLVLSAFLKALWKIDERPLQGTTDDRMIVSVLPGFETPKAGVQVANPTTGAEVRLTGSFDYFVTCYANNRSNESRDRMLQLGPATPADNLKRTLKSVRGSMFLVQAKHADDRHLEANLPRAVSQAVALGEFLQESEIRFVITNGRSWMFCVAHKNNGHWTHYDSVLRELPKAGLEEEAPVMLSLLSEWLHPSEGECVYRFSS